MIRAYWLFNQELHQGSEELIAKWQAQGGYIWVDVDQETDDAETRVLTQLGCNHFAINDVQRPNHPPKLEHFDQYSFVLYRHILGISADLELSMQNVGLFFNDSMLISVHDLPFIDTDLIAQRAQFLSLLQSPVELMCTLVRHSAITQLDMLAGLEESISDIEERMTRHGTDSLLEEVLGYRGFLRRLKRVFDYHEKIFSQLAKEPQFLAKKNKNSQHAIRDVYDKFERLLNLVSLYYDLCGDLSDAYLSVSTHQLNRTMQVLTVITAIFIPLSFVAGVYGMNFENMPELQWRYGYFVVLGLMLTMAVGLLAVFKYKKWL